MIQDSRHLFLYTKTWNSCHMHEYKEEDIAAQSNTKHRLTRSKNRRPPQVRNQICQGTVDDLLFVQAVSWNKSVDIKKEITLPFSEV